MTRCSVFSVETAAIALLAALAFASPALVAASSETVPAAGLEALAETVRGLEARFDAGDSLNEAEIGVAQARLLVLDAQQRALPEAEAAGRTAILGKLRFLGLALYNLELARQSEDAAAELRRLRDYPRLVASGQTFVDGGPPANDDCASATVISTFPSSVAASTVDATNDGSASCGDSSTTPDVWYKVVATQEETFYFDTVGSDFDTVLSIHSACPGTVANELECDDDTFGVDASVGQFAPDPGFEFLVRVSGSTAATGNLQLNAGIGGVISGTVTEAATTNPVTSGVVRVYFPNGTFRSEEDIGVDGIFTVNGLFPADYKLMTLTSGPLQDELYDNVPCAPNSFLNAPTNNFDCNLADGALVAVRGTNTVTGIDFALEQGGAVEGQVTFSNGGAPIQNSEVLAYRQVSSSSASVESDFTDASGNYRIEGLPTIGQLYLVALAGSSGTVNEVYDDMPCGLDPCEPLTGTPVAVTVGVTTTGIDFALDTRAKITGTVQDSVSGQPLFGAQVRAVSLAAGGSFDLVFTDGLGQYTLDYPVDEDVLVWAGQADHAGEMYPNLPCEVGSPWTCDLNAATLVPFRLNQTTANIDLDLEAWGGIAGQVTKAADGSPFAGRKVSVWDSTATFVKTATADAGGSYTVNALSPGDYYVGSTDLGGYLGELYDGVFCSNLLSPPPACDLGAATLVSSTLNTITGGIDLALDKGGAILGKVSMTDGSSVVLNSRPIHLYDSGGSLAATKSLGFAGDYSFISLPPGTYFVATFGFEFLNEVWDDVPCGASTPLSCNPATGTPVSVALDEVRSAVNFVLFPNKTGFGGRVRRGTDSSAVDGVRIDLWNDLGTFVTSADSAADGSYFFEIGAGTYYASTTVPEGFLDQVYNGVPCPVGPASASLCDPTTGTPIVVSGAAPLLGVDFNLALSATVFTDGFESGTTSAWSVTVPGP